MLKIARKTYDELLAHAEKDLPIEACGYLAGRDGTVCSHYELENMDKSGTHFTFDPAQQFDALREMRKLGLRPAAVYHSHPTTPARPSAEDIRLAHDPDVSYVIVSLRDDSPVIKSFRIGNGVAEPEEISVIEEPDSDGQSLPWDRVIHQLDITKDKCPITFVKVKVKLAKLKEGDHLEVLLSEGEPLKNVPRSAEEQGHKVLNIEPDGPFHKVLIEK